MAKTQTYSKQHPTSQDHVVLIVETRRGYYACSFAKDERERPEEYTHDFIVGLWRESKKGFEPYDWSTGRYC